MSRMFTMSARGIALAVASARVIALDASRARGVALAASGGVCVAVLAACTPPLPPDVLAVMAESQVTCADGTSTVVVPEAYAGVMDAVSTALTAVCPGETVTEVPAGEPAPLAITSGTPSGEELAAFSSANCPTGEAIAVPAFATQVGVAYSILGLDGLLLGPDAVAGILDGSITAWNDPRIADANPDFDLTGLPSLALMRLDGPSGSVEAMTAWLVQQGAWAAGESATLTAGEAFATPTELSDAMLATEGAVAVMPVLQALTAGFAVANLPATPGADDPAATETQSIASTDTQLAKVGAGAATIVEETPTRLIVSAGLGGVPAPETFDAAASKVVLADGQPLVGWPVMATNHLLVCDTPTDPVPLSFAQYVVRLAGQGSMETFGVTPLPEPIRVRTFTPLKVTVSVDGESAVPSAAPSTS